jgi:heme exporter protein B
MSSGPRIPLLQAAWLVLRKDWMIEWRTRARLTALIFFSLSTLLLFSFAMGPDTEALRRHAPGYLWLALFFASVLSLGESFRVESENQALLGLVLTPVEPRAIFLGKVFGNASLLFGLSLLLLPVSVALYDINLSKAPGSLVLVLLLGSIGISAPGIVYSAISANARARDVMLPLLLFPVLVPLLLASVNATRFTLGPDPQEQLGSWLKYLSVGFLIFPKVAEED